MRRKIIKQVDKKVDVLASQVAKLSIESASRSYLETRLKEYAKQEDIEQMQRYIDVALSSLERSINEQLDNIRAQLDDIRYIIEKLMEDNKKEILESVSSMCYLKRLFKFCKRD